MTRPTKGKKAKLPLMPIQQQQIGNQLSRPKKTQPRDTRGLGNSRERPKRPAEIDPSLHEESDEEEEEDEDQEEDGEEQCHTVRLYVNDPSRNLFFILVSVITDTQSSFHRIQIQILCKSC